MDRENTRRMEVFQPVWYKDHGITNERSFRTITAFHIVAKKSRTSLTLNSENMFNAEMQNLMQVQLDVKLIEYQIIYIWIIQWLHWERFFQEYPTSPNSA